MFSKRRSPNAPLHLLRRRELLVGGAALGAYAALSGCGRSDSALLGDLAWLDEPAPTSFPLGAASGDATFDRAVLWTQYRGAAQLKLDVTRAVVNRDTGETEDVPVVTGRAVTPGDGGFVHATIDGLEPGASYRYRFFEDVGSSSTGQQANGVVRAAIAPASSERLVFTTSVCTKNGRNFGTLARASEIPADVHLLLGDTVYADGARTLEDYRGKWHENLSTAAYRRMRRTRGLIATWDDHEVTNDWSGDEVSLQQRTNGEAAFFEHTPMQRNAEVEGRLWRTVRWGRTAEFFVLDCRSERRPDTRGTPDAEYISKDQFDWLTAGLKASTARFKVILNSVPIGRFPGAFAAWTKDQWVGYGAQRDALLTFLDEEAIDGAFFISGDFHLSSFGKVDEDGRPGARITEVLVGAAATSSPNPFWGMVRGPMWDFVTTVENVGVFGLDPATGVVDVQWIDAAGKALARRSFVP